MSRLLALLVVLAAPTPGEAQAAPAVPGAGYRIAADSLEVLGQARDAQARFERLRRRESPRVWSAGGSSCDEIVGRICLRLESGSDWWPGPEPLDITRARERLLDALNAAGTDLPGDRWILGQRVFYLAEAERIDDALRLARVCRPADPPWCTALEGYLLHRSHRYPEAEAAFARALGAMSPEARQRWRDPRDLLDRDGRELLDRADPGSRRRSVERFWSLSDPLFLVDGSDRWTEHLSRQVLARIREDASTPYQLRWGDDLAEVLVRYGWEVGWERITPRPGSLAGSAGAVGHHHPESRDHTPPGAALARLGETVSDEWNPGSRRLPRTGYAPSYAPVFLPADAEIYRVPRGDTLLLVALVALPADTTWHRSHGHAPPQVPSRFSPRSGQVGAFAWRDGRVVAGKRKPGVAGVLQLALPPGEYLLSMEAWAPDSARAGRLREGLDWEGLPRDVPALSDLFLVDPQGREPAVLEDVHDQLVPGSLGTGRSVRVAWEVNGLGWRPETLRYHLDVVRADESLVRRVGRFLRLVGDAEAVTLSWTEAGPLEPGPHFRSALVTLPPGTSPGLYRVRLRVETGGRETLEAARRITVVPSSR